jgi:hypothetical protein
VAYEFAGIFAKPSIAQPDSLPPDAVWRVITAPFSGVGVRLPSLAQETPDVYFVSQLVQQFGLASGDWLYITYVCWGGAIDFVYGFGSCGGRTFGPVEESAQNAVEEAYTGLMAEFGVSTEDAMRFDPFVRGFWGE